jgi:hypothetical protein
LLPAGVLVVAGLMAGLAMPASAASAPTADPPANSGGLVLALGGAPTIAPDHAAVATNDLPSPANRGCCHTSSLPTDASPFRPSQNAPPLPAGTFRLG